MAFNLIEFVPQKIEGNQQHHTASLFLLVPQQGCLKSLTAAVQPEINYINSEEHKKHGNQQHINKDILLQ